MHTDHTDHTWASDIQRLDRPCGPRAGQPCPPCPWNSPFFNRQQETTLKTLRLEILNPNSTKENLLNGNRSSTAIPHFFPCGAVLEAPRATPCLPNQVMFHQPQRLLSHPKPWGYAMQVDFVQLRWFSCHHFIIGRTFTQFRCPPFSKVAMPYDPSYHSSHSKFGIRGSLILPHTKKKKLYDINVLSCVCGEHLKRCKTSNSGNFTGFQPDLC